MQGSSDNVVGMFDCGWDSSGRRATIVLEFMKYGSLLGYLQWSGRMIRVSHSTRAAVPQDTLQPPCHHVVS